MSRAAARTRGAQRQGRARPSEAATRPGTKQAEALLAVVVDRLRAEDVGDGAFTARDSLGTVRVQVCGNVVELAAWDRDGHWAGSWALRRAPDLHAALTARVREAGSGGLSGVLLTAFGPLSFAWSVRRTARDARELEDPRRLLGPLLRFELVDGGALPWAGRRYGALVMFCRGSGAPLGWPEVQGQDAVAGSEGRAPVWGPVVPSLQDALQGFMGEVFGVWATPALVRTLLVQDAGEVLGVLESRQVEASRAVTEAQLALMRARVALEAWIREG